MKIIVRSPFQPFLSISHKLQHCRVLSHFPKTTDEQKQQKNHKNNNYKEKFTSKSILLGAATTSLLAYYYLVNDKQQRYVYAAKENNHGKSSEHKNPHYGCHGPGVWRPDLPMYTRGDVEQHDTIKKRVWVTFREGVYDITDFIVSHHGGDIIMLAAGGPVEPFWATYGFHEELPFILLKLETMRIGNLCKADQVKMSDYDDPYIDQPERAKEMVPAITRPFCATVRLDYLINNFITPAKWWYVKNRVPVPVIDPQDHQLTLEVEGTDINIAFTMDELLQMEKSVVMATLMCSTNLKREMLQIKGEDSAKWGPGAASNAVWTGVKLCDLLEKVGITAEDYGDYKHVQFEGVDRAINGVPYSISIPIWKAVDKKGDVLVAYLINGEPLPPDHGFPVRMVVPGHIGSRSCKWLTKIVVSQREATGYSQAHDYKSFNPSAQWEGADYGKAPAIQPIPVYSFICSPQNNDKVQVVEGSVTVKGYAHAGGGNKIIRVDVTSDSGKTWRAANLDFQNNKSDYPHNWAWTIWSCKLPVDKSQREVEVWCKAVDTSSNTQPETLDNIYNFLGVICNAYHKIKFQLAPCN